MSKINLEHKVHRYTWQGLYGLVTGNVRWRLHVWVPLLKRYIRVTKVDIECALDENPRLSMDAYVSGNSLYFFPVTKGKAR